MTASSQIFMKLPSAAIARRSPVFVIVMSLLASAFGETIQPLVEVLSENADAWKITPLPGQWRALGEVQGVTRKEAAAAEPVFDVSAQRIIATEAAGKLSRLDVLFMERGAAAMDEAYLQSMRQTAAKVSAGVQAKAGKPGLVVKPAAGSPAGTVIQEWTTPGAVIRLAMEPGVRLWVTMTALPSGQTPQGAAKPALPLKDALKARVAQRENGDVLITGLPEVADAVEICDLMLRITESLARLYEWKIDVEATARTAGWEPDSQVYQVSKLFAAVTKEAKVRMKQANALELLDVQRWIDRGQPVPMTHVFTEIRHEYQIDFTRKFADDPKLELPSAKDAAEKKKWPSPQDEGYYVSESLIVGYNKKRGELILSYPGWGAEAQNLRVREEEAATSFVASYLIWPD